MRKPHPSGNTTAQNHMPIYKERNLDLYRDGLGDGVAGESASTEQESAQEDITLPNAREVNRQLREERKALKRQEESSRRGYATGLGVLARVQKAHPNDPKAQVAMFFRDYTIKAGTGRLRPVSQRTASVYADDLIRLVDDLRAARASIKNLGELGKTHVLVLIKYWSGKGQGAATLQNKLSVLRRFLTIIGKEHAVPRGSALRSWLNEQGVDVDLKRHPVATTSKAWIDHDVDLNNILSRLREVSSMTAIQLEVQAAFGLRVKESIQLNPTAADYGDILRVIHGTKGGLPRDIDFDPDPALRAWQREVLERAKFMAQHNKKGILSLPGKRLDQSKAHFYYQMRRFGITQKQLGVTAHGLRHQYAARRYQQVAGFGAPVGPNAPQQITAHIREADLRAREVVSRQLGHSRIDIPRSYVGSLNQLEKSRRQRITDWIERTEENPQFIQALKECGITQAWLGGRFALGQAIDEHEKLRLIVAQNGYRPLGADIRTQLKTWLGRIFQRGVDLSEQLEAGSPEDSLEIILC